MRSTLAFAALWLGTMVPFSSSISREEAQKISICALATHGADYDGRRVMVSARLIVSTYTLHDQQCPEAHVTVILARLPPAAACQRVSPPTFGCRNDNRKYIDGTFSGTFTASSTGTGGQLRIEWMYYQIDDAGP
jgi:hypothetical protein